MEMTLLKFGHHHLRSSIRMAMEIRCSPTTDGVNDRTNPTSFSFQTTSLTGEKSGCNTSYPTFHSPVPCCWSGVNIGLRRVESPRDAIHVALSS